MISKIKVRLVPFSMSSLNAVRSTRTLGRRKASYRHRTNILVICYRARDAP